MSSDSKEIDIKVMEHAKAMLYRVSAELSLSVGSNPDDQQRIDSARRMAADTALRLEDHLRGF